MLAMAMLAMAILAMAKWPSYTYLLYLRDGEDGEGVHAHARVVHFELAVAGVDDVENAVHRETRLGNVGRHDHLVGVRCGHIVSPARTGGATVSAAIASRA